MPSLFIVFNDSKPNQLASQFLPFYHFTDSADGRFTYCTWINQVLKRNPFLLSFYWINSDDLLVLWFPKKRGQFTWNESHLKSSLQKFCKSCFPIDWSKKLTSIRNTFWHDRIWNKTTLKGKQIRNRWVGSHRLAVDNWIWLIGELFISASGFLSSNCFSYSAYPYPPIR